MAKYDITCPTCGEVRIVALYGNARERRYMLERTEKKCRKCRDAEQRVLNENADERFGLPALIGSEKQVTWAGKIRAKHFEIIDDACHNTLDEFRFEAFYGIEDAWRSRRALMPTDPEFEYAFARLKQQTSASWWIDHRSDKSGMLLAEVFTKHPPEPDVDAGIVEAARDEATLRPQDPVTETIAEITVKDDTVTIAFPEKREDFRAIVKYDLGYSWIRDVWMRVLVFTNGKAADRAAEAGNKLLLAGFSVRIFDPIVRAAAVNGAYEPECRRWIMAAGPGAQYEGWFLLRWTERDDRIYGAARQLPRSKYVQPDVAVPSEFVDEVRDFSQLYGFQWSPGAKDLADIAVARRNTATLVAPVPGQQEEVPTPEYVIPDLVAPDDVEVDDEFKD